MALTQVNGGMLDSVAQQVGFRNRIINGAMMIDQRNAGASVAVNGTTLFGVDRFKTTTSGGGVITVQRSTTAPAGFTNSLSHSVTTADSSIAAGDLYVTDHIIEGYNVADFAWGTANAKPITISFNVRSSVTGTFGLRVCNGSFNRSYVTTFTVNSANTDETKTVTIAGDTSGTWATDNSAGICVSWDLGSGTNWNASSANTWSAGNYLRTSGCVNWIANAGATFYITGVQLEKGSTATSFDYRPFTTELQLCQRYYEKTYPYSVVPGTSTGSGQIWSSASSFSDSNLGAKYWFKVTKRNTSWSYTAYQAGGTSGSWEYSRSGASGTGSVIMADAGTDSCLPYLNVGAAWTNAQINGHLVVDNEL